MDVNESIKRTINTQSIKINAIERKQVIIFFTMLSVIGGSLYLLSGFKSGAWVLAWCVSAIYSYGIHKRSELNRLKNIRRMHKKSLNY